jgi:holo-[acyl-carrier protein] synthase
VIIGVGVDLVDVPRMERTLSGRWAKRFISRVFSEEEIGACRRSSRPPQAFAARFAAKEALAKALGTGFSRGIGPGTILVRGGERRQPSIELIGAALAVATSMNVASIHVSLTHTDSGACAVVVVEGRECPLVKD